MSKPSIMKKRVLTQNRVGTGNNTPHFLGNSIRDGKKQISVSKSCCGHRKLLHGTNLFVVLPDKSNNDKVLAHNDQRLAVNAERNVL